jgi:hypothetical protein
MNTFFQSKDGKLFPMVPPVAPRPIFVSKKVLSGGKTYRTGWPRGIAGRTFIVERSLLYGKRRRGKPPEVARRRRDLIAAYVRELQVHELRDRLQGKPRRSWTKILVPRAAAFFKTHQDTVWRALRARHRGRTIYAQWYVAYLLTCTQWSDALPTLATPPPIAPVKVPTPADFPNDPHTVLLSGR